MIVINTELVKVIQTGKAQYIRINYSSVVTGAGTLLCQSLSVPERTFERWNRGKDTLNIQFIPKQALINICLWGGCF